MLGTPVRSRWTGDSLPRSGGRSRQADRFRLVGDLRLDVLGPLMERIIRWIPAPPTSARDRQHRRNTRRATDNPAPAGGSGPELLLRHQARRLDGVPAPSRLRRDRLDPQRAADRVRGHRKRRMDQTGTVTDRSHHGVVSGEGCDVGGAAGVARRGDEGGRQIRRVSGRAVGSRAYATGVRTLVVFALMVVVNVSNQPCCPNRTAKGKRQLFRAPSLSSHSNGSAAVPAGGRSLRRT